MKNEDTVCKNLFGDKILEEKLSTQDYKNYISLKSNYQEIPKELAHKIAIILREWALENEVDYYSHIFFPFTEKTSSKQNYLNTNDKSMLPKTFVESNLFVGETDASSFPTGNNIQTHNARGVTKWDYNSPIRIKEYNTSKILQIPSTLHSNNGDSLDLKTPLNKALKKLNKHATSILNKLGFSDVESVNLHIGGEQEYFILKNENISSREDILNCGRALFGSDILKTQKHYRNYFSNIDKSTFNFMHDVNTKLSDIGIQSKLQHSEVAPNQYEIVTHHKPANIACENDITTMETLESVAKSHNLKVLLHEKPFSNMNGSGKHLNWSLITNTGINLIDSYQENKILFLLFFSVVLSAVNDYDRLYKLSTSNHGNFLRLGGYEAPPSIISVYSGNKIEEILNNITTLYKKNKSYNLINKNITTILGSEKYVCDRNRTSPFAFTGDRFEFRMVGSKQSLYLPTLTIATTLSEKLQALDNQLNNKTFNSKTHFINSPKLTSDIIKVISENYTNNKRIIFNGNGYSKQWFKEAKLRKLFTESKISKIYEILNNDNIVSVFKNQEILNNSELDALKTTLDFNFILTCTLEAKCMLKITYSKILPSLQNISSKFCGMSANSDYKLFLKPILDTAITNIVSYSNTLNNHMDNYNKIKSLARKMKYCEQHIIPTCNLIKESYDSIESYLPYEFQPFKDYDYIFYN